MSSKRPNLIHLTLQQIEKLKEHLWSDMESIAAVQDVTKLHLNGGTAPRTIIITNGAIYMFKVKSFNKVELDKEFSIVSLNKISYIEPNILNLAFNSKTIVIKTDDALNIGNLLTYQYSKVTYHVPNHSRLRVESTPPEALKEYTRIKSRPSALFQTRLIVLSHYYNTKFLSSDIRMYRDWDHIHSGTFKISSSFKHNGDIQAIAHAISWDEDLKNLDVDGFAPDHLGLFLSTIFKRSFALNKITIQNFPDKIENNFDFKVDGNSAIFNLNFVNVASQTIVSFFNALKDYTGRIKMLRISKCKFSKEELASVFDAIQNLLCFMKLSNLQIDNLVIDEFPFQEFKGLVNKLHSFNTLTINDLKIDGVLLLQAICENAKNIQHIILSDINFKEDNIAKELVFPESFTLLDVSQSLFSVKTFKLIIQSLLGKARTIPLFIYASKLKLNKGLTTKDLMKEINTLELHPNLFELCWSDNEMLPDDVQSLITFLKTQSNLKFLDISRTIYPKNKPKESLGYISKYINESKVEGLSIASKSDQQIPSELIEFLKNINDSQHNLNSLHLNNSGMKNPGIEVINDLINKCDSLQEIDVDGLNVSTTNDLVLFYNGLLLNSHLSFISNPKLDLKNLNVDLNNLPPEVNKLLKELKRKKLPRTSQERLLQYEQLHVDDDNILLDEHGLEFLLTLKEPESLITPKQKKGIIKSKNNALAELNSVMRSMVKTMKGETKETKYDPLPTAELIMKYLSTSKKALEISENNQ